MKFVYFFHFCLSNSRCLFDQTIFCLRIQQRVSKIILTANYNLIFFVNLVLFFLSNVKFHRLPFKLIIFLFIQNLMVMEFLYLLLNQIHSCCEFIKQMSKVIDLVQISQCTNLQDSLYAF